MRYSRFVFSIVVVALTGALACSSAETRSDQEPTSSTDTQRQAQALVVTYDVEHLPGATPADRQKAVERTVAAVDRRINSLGFPEAHVRAVGTDEIVVSFPGMTELDAEVADLIARQGRFRIHVIDDAEASAFFGGLAPLPNDVELIRDAEDRPALKHQDREVLQDLLDGKVDEEHVVVYEFFPTYVETENILVDAARSHWKAYYAEREPVMTGESVASAEVSLSPTGNEQPYVTMMLEPQGQRSLAAATREHTGERLALVMDDVVVASPVVVAPIEEGAPVRISLGDVDGDFSRLVQRAERLELVLEQGALAVPISKRDQRLATYRARAMR